MSFNFLELKEFLLDLLKANIGIFFFPCTCVMWELLGYSSDPEPKQ